MAARAVITLSPEQYLSGLKQIEAATAETTNKMSAGVSDFGRTLTRGGKLAQTVSTEIGAAFGKAGNLISSIASGPAAILAASLGTIAGIGVDLWDRMTVSTAEYALKLDKTASLEEKRLEQMKEQQTAEDKYIERLSALADRENLGNAEKAEAVRLTDILNSRYGDLGITIDDTTGKIEGLTAAQNKLNAAQKAGRMEQLERVIGIEKEKSDSVASVFMGGGSWYSRTMDYLTGGEGAKSAEYYKSMSIPGRMETAKEQLSAATTEKEIRFWSEEIDRLERILSLEDELNTLRKTGVSSIKEEVAELQKASETERKRADEKAAADEKARREQEKAIEAAAIAEQKAADAVQKRLEDQRRRMQERRGSSYRELRQMALKAMGQGRQADIEAAIYDATRTKGEKLTADEYNEVVGMAGMKRELQDLMASAQSTAPQLYAPRVDSLIARGGSAAPVKMPEVEKLQSQSVKTQEKIAQLCQRLLNSAQDWNTI